MECFNIRFPYSLSLPCFVMSEKIRKTNKKNSFTLYPTHSSVGRGNIVSRNCVPHSLPNCPRHCVLSGGTQRGSFALVPERGNINVLIVNKNSFPRVGMERTTVALQSNPCALRLDGATQLTEV